MSTAVEQSRGIETLAWITDDEAEFWTSSSPRRKNPKEIDDSIVKNPDGSHFKWDNSLNTKNQDDLFVLYKEKIAREANDVNENAGKTQIFEFDQDVGINENIPGVNMSFINRLIHQLTRPSASEIDVSSDEEFIEIDETEITAVINNSIEQSLTEKDHLKTDSSLQIFIRSFIEELNEEADVIRGRIDDETLFNRRSRRARFAFSPIGNKQNSLEQKSI